MPKGAGLWDLIEGIRTQGINTNKSPLTQGELNWAKLKTYAHHSLIALSPLNLF